MHPLRQSVQGLPRVGRVPGVPRSELGCLGRLVSGISDDPDTPGRPQLAAGDGRVADIAETAETNMSLRGPAVVLRSLRRGGGLCPAAATTPRHLGHLRLDRLL